MSCLQHFWKYLRRLIRQSVYYNITSTEKAPSGAHSRTWITLTCIPVKLGRIGLSGRVQMYRCWDGTWGRNGICCTFVLSSPWLMGLGSSECKERLNTKCGISTSSQDCRLWGLNAGNVKGFCRTPQLQPADPSW